MNFLSVFFSATIFHVAQPIINGYNNIDVFDPDIVSCSLAETNYTEISLNEYHTLQETDLKQVL